MNTTTTTTLRSFHPRRVALLAVLGLAIAPTVSAAPLTEPAPVAAADTDCEQSKVEIEIDVASGQAYMLSEGSWVSIEDGIDAYFGDLDTVTLQIHYSTGQWYLGVEADGNHEARLHTNSGGSLRYSIHDDVETYVLTSIEDSSYSTGMATMTPVVPDIIIRPKKTCPPST